MARRKPTVREADVLAPTRRRRIFTFKRVAVGTAAVAATVGGVLGIRKLRSIFRDIQPAQQIARRTLRGGQRAVQATGALDLGLGMARRTQRKSVIGRGLIDLTGTVSRPLVAARGFLKGFF